MQRVAAQGDPRQCDSGNPAFVRGPEGWRLAGINTYVHSARGQSGGGGVAVAARRERILCVIARE